jgi:hypothetical protein
MGLCNATDEAVLGTGANISLPFRIKPDSNVTALGRFSAINRCFNESLTAAFCGAINSFAAFGSIIGSAVKETVGTEKYSTLKSSILAQLPAALSAFISN